MRADAGILSFHMTLGIGKILALGSFGISLAVSMYDDEQLKPTFARAIISLLLLSSLGWVLEQIRGTSEALTQFVERLGDPGKLIDWITDAYKTSTQGSGGQMGHGIGSSASSGGLLQQGTAVLAQTTRAGVWLLAQLAADFFFAASAKLIEVGRQILWSLGSFLAPFLIGMVPLYPRLGASALLFLLEVSLWEPMLRLMQIVSFPVILKELSNKESLGITVIVAEFISICLFCAVPALVHLLLSGSWSAASLLPGVSVRRIPRVSQTRVESPQNSEIREERR